jgi:hypothetical protein
MVGLRSFEEFVLRWKGVLGALWIWPPRMIVVMEVGIAKNVWTELGSE